MPRRERGSSLLPDTFEQKEATELLSPDVLNQGMVRHSENPIIVSTHEAITEGQRLEHVRLPDSPVQTFQKDKQRMVGRNIIRESFLDGVLSCTVCHSGRSAMQNSQLRETMGCPPQKFALSSSTVSLSGLVISPPRASQHARR